MFSTDCPTCSGRLECMAGESAHSGNWYCPVCDKEPAPKTVTTGKPRITEDDAREIAVNYAAYAATRLAAKTLPITFNDWLDEGGRQLLDKLNDK